MADEYLGQPLTAPPADLASAELLVLRYLAAFGPATARDIQAWSGLTRLREVTDRLSGQSRAFGGGLLDLPDSSALEITPFTPLTPQETDAITAEAATLLAFLTPPLAFLTPPQTPRDLHLHPPAS